MEIITSNLEILRFLCQALSQWGMLISFNEINTEELFQAAPFLQQKQFQEAVMCGRAFIFSSSKEEIYVLYNQIDSNPETPVQIYACISSPQGEIQTENT